MKSFIFILLLTLPKMTLFNFTPSADLSNWRVVNDGVMGGLSQANFQLDATGNGIYTGQVSLENNGGFSSLRYQMEQRNVSGHQQICIILKGDGKRYQFRVKSDLYERHSYIHYFETTGEWQEIVLDLADFYPAFRGRTLDIPNYPAQQLAEIAFLIGNKKEESFRLELGEISLK